jgi:hypothetical protein
MEHDSNLRDLAAMFAMLKMAWHRGEEAEDAKDCWLIADEMIKARNLEPEEGLAAIKKGKRNVRKNEDLR